MIGNKIFKAILNNDTELFDKYIIEHLRINFTFNYINEKSHYKYKSLNKNVKVNTSPLIFAVIRNRKEMVNKLLSFDQTNINFQDSFNNNALIIAFYKNNLEIANLLLEKKPNLNLHNNYNESILNFIIKNRHYDIFFSIIDKINKDIINLKDEENKNILILAINNISFETNLEIIDNIIYKIIYKILSRNDLTKETIQTTINFIDELLSIETVSLDLDYKELFGFDIAPKINYQEFYQQIKTKLQDYLIQIDLELEKRRNLIIERITQARILQEKKEEEEIKLKEQQELEIERLQQELILEAIKEENEKLPRKTTRFGTEEKEEILDTFDDLSEELPIPIRQRSTGTSEIEPINPDIERKITEYLYTIFKNNKDYIITNLPDWTIDFDDNSGLYIYKTSEYLDVVTKRRKRINIPVFIKIKFSFHKTLIRDGKVIPNRIHFKHYLSKDLVNKPWFKNMVNLKLQNVNGKLKITEKDDDIIDEGYNKSFRLGSDEKEVLTVLEKLLEIRNITGENYIDKARRYKKKSKNKYQLKYLKYKNKYLQLKKLLRPTL
jgi:hypothetical protein